MNNLISIKELCTNHQIEVSFIYSLTELGLIQLILIEETEYIDLQKIAEIEKMIRMHYELNINLEGIDTTIRLLQKIELLQEEISILKCRLKIYEEEPEVSE